MSLFSGSELFEAGATNGDDAGELRGDSTSRAQPSATANGDATTAEVLRGDSTSQVQPSSSAADGNSTIGAAQADSASRVQPSSAVGGCGTVGSVCVGLVDEVGLSDEGLRSRLKVLGRAESTLAAMKSRALAELSRRHNKRDAQRLVRDELQTSKRDAKRDIETATRLAELPATSGALNSGDIPVGHAQLIARAAGESPIDETLLVEAAGSEPFDEFMQTVKLHQRDVAVDDGQSLLDRQRKKRKARIFESSDSGMFVLTGEFDQITGARIATALTAKERQLWHREDPNNRATPQQRMADALAELISEPTGDSRSVGTDLLVIADFDVLEQQLENPRLVDGSPIPTGELHKMALEANLLPSIFDTKTQDMWLGRRVRTATEAQRIALIARDQHCIGCGANPLWCQAHHIIWWSKNGPTDLENLVLVCNDCHHKIHDDGWQVHKHPETGKYQLKPPTQPPTSPSEKPLSAPSAKRSLASSNQPSTHQINDHPTTPIDKSTKNPPDEPPTHTPSEHPTTSAGEPSTHQPSNRPTALTNKSTRNTLDEPPTHQPSQHPTLSARKPSTHQPSNRPTASTKKSASNTLDERSAVSSEEVSTISTDRADRDRTRADPAQPDADENKSAINTLDEPPTHQPSQHPTLSARKPSTHQPSNRPTASTKKSASNTLDERSAVSSGEVSTISTDRANRDRTRADPAQPDARDATQSTNETAPGIAHGEQVQRKNQASSQTEQRHRTTRTTGHDPVDGIDTS